MAKKSIDNLDLKTAKVGRQIVKNSKSNGDTEIGNVIQNSLGILQEDGIYAYFVYLFSEKAENNGSNFYVVGKRTWNFLKKSEEGLGYLEEGFSKNNLSELDKILSDLDKTFFTKEVLEQILIYARYHAKAVGNSDDN